MKNKISFSLFVIAFFSITACAQVDNSEARKERIKANLLFLFPQLETRTVEIGDIEALEAAGMEQGRFIVDGQQQQPFLTTSDDTQFYLLAGGPFDLSKTEQDLAQEIAARKEAGLLKAREVHALLKPAVADLPYRGSADAPVTIVEFSDFQCPYCARATETMHQLIAKHAENVKLVYVQFPIESIHPWARTASIASVCAANQSNDAFWTLHDKYFEEQQALSLDNVVQMSQEYLVGSGINIDEWKACTTDKASDSFQTASALVDTSLKLGMEHGVSSTPAFFLNGHFVSGAQPLETFEEILQEALADQ